MRTSIDPETLNSVLRNLAPANTTFAGIYPGDSPARQPVHTVYGGAQIFAADTARKLGDAAIATLREYAPTAASFSKALGLKGSGANAALLYKRVTGKLKAEPVEDFRIDFEDGYGNRPDDEEDHHAESTGQAVATGLKDGTLPPFIGIRIKPFTEELKGRSARTLDIFCSTLLEASHGILPPNFVVTIPKVTIPEQITALVELLRSIETKNDLAAGSLRFEFMVETPQSIINSRGECTLLSFVAAGDGRCTAAHFGVYDYTASMGITAEYQAMDHASCDFARNAMKVALAGTGIWLSDGATNIIPVGPHRVAKGKKLSPRQKKENAGVVQRAWRTAFGHTTHSLVNGYYQGWDLHPAQLPVRYAAVYAFFLNGLEAASVRLKTFLGKAARASLIGDVFDDAATGQGMLNYFLRGIACGALTEDDASAAGLTIGELRSRSFVTILKSRRGAQ